MGRCTYASRTIYPQAKDACCINLPDANIVYVHPAYPCGDSIGITIKFCNSGYTELPADYPVAIYDSNPTFGSPNLLTNLTIDSMLAIDECLFITRTILDPTTSEVFVVAGDQGTNTPFDLACDFPLTNTEECGYYNNMRSSVIPDTISIVTFDGGYYLACPKIQDTIHLVAPPYLLNPVWNGQYATDTLTIYDGGTYYLEAITPCGEPWGDSLFVGEQFPHVEFPFSDTTICIGDTLIVDIPFPHESITWSDDSPFVAFSCIDSCERYGYHATMPGTYVITGSKNIGPLCSSSDTFKINFLASFELSYDTILCADSYVTIHDQTYLAADTTLYFSFSGANGCDSTHMYNLHLLDTFHITINEQACIGDSIWYDNQAIAAGDSHSFYYQSALGCDSTVTVQVSPLNTFETAKQLRICPNDSIQIFNQYQSQAGFYEQYFTAFNGCDSLHVVELVVYPNFEITSSVQASCPDEPTGSINLQISGTEPFTFEWSTGELEANLQEVAAGEYGVTVSDAEGCMHIIEFTVPAHSDLSYNGACTPQWYAPTAFSPNNDGINDRYTFYGNERAIRIEQLQIFDRWGNLVFQADDIAFNEEALGWDGNLKGKAMQPAVFVWKATVILEGGLKEVAYGDLLLMR